MLKKLLTPPVFEHDEEKSGKANAIHRIVLFGWGLALVSLVLSLQNTTANLLYVFATLVWIIVLVSVTILIYLGKVTPAGYVLSLTAVGLFSFLDYSGNGTPSVFWILSSIPILIGGLLLGAQAPIWIAILLSFLHGLFAYLGMQTPGLQISQGDLILNIVTASTGFMITALLLMMALARIQTMLRRAQASEQSVISSNAQLRQLTQKLEQSVEELEQRSSQLKEQSEQLERQTKELEHTNETNRRQAMQFQAIAEIAQAIAQVKKLDELLPGITHTVSEKMGFYHTGIFLIDEAGQYAVLAAANSEGGQKMLQRKHRLEVGKVGVVGNAATGITRIALDVGEDAVYFANPDLPDTRSEIALPLLAEDQVIGVLDVQSTEPNAFGQEDVKTLSTLAAQVSIAIQNARLLEDTQKSLDEAQFLYRQFIQKEWSQVGQRRKVHGYQYTTAGITPAEAVDSATAEQIAAQKVYLEQGDETSTLAIPITLRGEVIGILDMQAPANRGWRQDEIDIAQAVAERVAISAENARLFEQTTERAERERKVSEITSKIRATNDPNEMLQIALNELKQALKTKNVRILPYQPRQGQEKVQEES